jgi:hypothetical protein
LKGHLHLFGVTQKPLPEHSKPFSFLVQDGILQVAVELYPSLQVLQLSFKFQCPLNSSSKQTQLSSKSQYPFPLHFPS